MAYSKEEIKKANYSFRDIVSIINNCENHNELFRVCLLLEDSKRDYSLSDLYKIEGLINLKRHSLCH